MSDNKDPGYNCWLDYKSIKTGISAEKYREYIKTIVVTEQSVIINSAYSELEKAIFQSYNIKTVKTNKIPDSSFTAFNIIGKNKKLDDYLSSNEKSSIKTDGFILKNIKKRNLDFVLIAGTTDKSILYGVFALLREMACGTSPDCLNIIDNPQAPLRMLNNWDNIDGTIERGYSGNSFYFENGGFSKDFERIKDFARIMASIGLNAVVINNVNVRGNAAYFIDKKYLGNISKIAEIFRSYGIKIYLSINYASPMIIDNLKTADPLDNDVKKWWKDKVKEIYKSIPDFGGFLVKADSEFTPGPFTYGRNHAEGANMLADALSEFGGIVVWRCFVYNCVQDWRDKITDRARAAYDNFIPIDGKFLDNVVLQIKNGPLDFQVREPVSPLLGGLSKTNQVIEFQAAQEYTGQQKHLCYLAPMWKEILDFDTFAKGENSTIKKIVTGNIFEQNHCGFAAVSNTGNDPNWTGHDLAQANLYAYGRLSWNTELKSDEIAIEWIKMTFGGEAEVIKIVLEMLMSSWSIYESYNAPLGIGWMVNPSHHYGPSVDGYEYSKWGTYHRADLKGIGVDRSVKNGTGFAGLYHKPNSTNYETPETCPEELILFFHHLPYTYKLKSGKTVIQHIYDTHFEGVERVEEMIQKWKTLNGKIDPVRFERTIKRLEEQLDNAKEWRDVINSYFYRKSGIDDISGRKIY